MPAGKSTVVFRPGTGMPAVVFNMRGGITMFGGSVFAG